MLCVGLLTAHLLVNGLPTDPSPLVSHQKPVTLSEAKGLPHHPRHTSTTQHSPNHLSLSPSFKHKPLVAQAPALSLPAVSLSNPPNGSLPVSARSNCQGTTG